MGGGGEGGEGGGAQVCVPQVQEGLDEGWGGGGYKCQL